MELAFAERELRDLCLNGFLAEQTLGKQVAEKLKARLADFAAVAAVSELFVLPGRLRELSDDRRGQLVVDLSEGKQLVFTGGHAKERLLESGEIDWSCVRRVKILGVEEGHE